MSAIEVTARSIGANHRAMVCKLHSEYGADAAWAIANRCIWEASDVMAEAFGPSAMAEELYRLGDHLTGGMVPVMTMAPSAPAAPAPPPAPVPHPDFVPPPAPQAPAHPSPIEEPPRVINQGRDPFAEFLREAPAEVIAAAKTPTQKLQEATQIAFSQYLRDGGCAMPGDVIQFTVIDRAGSLSAGKEPSTREKFAGPLSAARSVWSPVIPWWADVIALVIIGALACVVATGGAH